jgi:hypothetical protein
VSDFSLSWNLSRQRFVDEISGLTDEQLRWKPYPGCLSIGQSALHVAGVETSFGGQLQGKEFSEAEAKVKSSATEGVVNDNPFPFDDSEITALLVAETLAASKAVVEGIITEPTEEVLAKQLKSALGPMISGQGAFTRLSIYAAWISRRISPRAGLPSKKQPRIPKELI